LAKDHSAREAGAEVAWRRNRLGVGGNLGIVSYGGTVRHFVGHPLYPKCLQAIRMGSVFFGANTHIGNGPDFMIKAIADQQKAHTPTFLGYIFKFTVPYMLPMLVIVWWLFFRG
jgi:Na+/H+ antiporter NhaD/arsenite permease-like protein